MIIIMLQGVVVVVKVPVAVVASVIALEVVGIVNVPEQNIKAIVNVVNRFLFQYFKEQTAVMAIRESYSDWQVTVMPNT